MFAWTRRFVHWFRQSIRSLSSCVPTMAAAVPMSDFPMNNMPDDCFFDVFDRLPGEDVLKTDVVCHRWLDAQANYLQLFDGFCLHKAKYTTPAEEICWFEAQVYKTTQQEAQQNSTKLAGVLNVLDVQFEDTHHKILNDGSIELIDKEDNKSTMLLRRMPIQFGKDVRKLVLYGVEPNIPLLEQVLQNYWTKVEHFTFLLDNKSKRLSVELLVRVLDKLNPDTLRHLIVTVGERTARKDEDLSSSRFAPMIHPRILEPLESLFIREQDPIFSIVSFYNTKLNFKNLKHLALINSEQGFNYLTKKDDERVEQLARREMQGPGEPSPVEPCLFDTLTHLTLSASHSNAFKKVSFTRFVQLKSLNLIFYYIRSNQERTAFFDSFLRNVPPSLVDLRLDIRPNCLLSLFPLEDGWKSIVPFRQFKHISIICNDTPTGTELRPLVTIFQDWDVLLINHKSIKPERDTVTLIL